MGMIKKIISKLIGNTIKKPTQEKETQTSLLQKKNENYVGVPAPVILSSDPWFGSATKSEKGIEYEQKIVTESKIQEEQRKETTQEPENIHQVMYEKATKNWTTISETQGGSENFQEGPSGWNSGTGMRQFHK